jgi:ABC-type bacteriocin/lantibiotic exporter with double-glycine peptidase domain
MSSTPLLEGKNIHFQYGDEVIFDQFNFKINKGDRIVLRGDSGSGKTTLFRLILGFESLQQGEILFKGNTLKEPKTIRDLRKNSAWLPQDLNIGTGSVNEVILFPFTFQAHRKSQPDQSQIESTLRDLGLNPDEILLKSYLDLSTGQRQRVGLAISVLLNQPFILLDEPTSALDRESKSKAADLLLKQNDRTVLSTSHDPFWVNRCDTVIDLNKGS